MTSGGAETLLARCSFPQPGAPVACAVSGGPDSLALLVLATAAGCEVTAWYVDHGLRPGTDAEAEFVAAVAADAGAAFQCRQAPVSAGPNLEARARDARYAVLPSNVATGHTADDQAETVLLALLRGSAWDGLGAMEPGPRKPILALRRADTEQICRDAGLHPLRDVTNADPVHRRNRIRAELIPLLNDIADRDVVPVLTRQAELLRDGAGLLEELAAASDPTDAKALAAAPRALARLVVRRWLWSETGAAHPPDLAAVDRVLAVAAGQYIATEVGRHWRVERHEQRLHLARSGAQTSQNL